MHDAVIIDAVRTPVGRRNGVLSEIHPADLSAHVLDALAERNGLDPGDVDDVIWGCVGQAGEQSTNIGRTAVLAAGWPETIPATTVDRQCGSSQQSVHFAAAGLAAGHYDLAVAGGVESMSRVPLGASATEGPGDPNSQRVLDRYGVDGFNQLHGAEMIADQWSISRERCDEIALESHRRAAAATNEGRFDDEITFVEVAGGGGTTSTINSDGGIRSDSTMETLANLPTVLDGEDRVITAGNASQISDGAAVLLMTTPAVARSRGWKPLARIHTVALVGVDPVTMLTGPIPATAKVLNRSGLALDDIDHFEINEAFASVIGAWRSEYDVDDDKLNPNGGAIALGHPLGATGARLMTTMVHALRRSGGRYGLQTMCEGGGQANATIIEML